jgi:signal transduction histidine kinase
LGLITGIQLKLQQLRERGILTLYVIEELRHLVEPECNSDWMDAREDIFRFFNEAIANIIHHAQPPHGTATYVKVSLLRQDNRCHLVIENDGYEPNHQTHEGGYGTKSMNAIAAALPGGKWERQVLPQEKVQVELTWEHNFNHSSSVFLNLGSGVGVNHTQPTIHIA